MNFFKKLSFKWKITSMILTLITVMFIGAMFNLFQMKNTFEEAFLFKMQVNAKSLGEKIKAQFFERYGDVQAFALNNAIQSMNGSEMQTDLDEYVTLYGIYDLILVVDTKGQYVASNSKDPTGLAVKVDQLKKTSFADAAWFKAAMSGQFTEDKKSGFVGTYFENTQYDSLFKLAFDQDKKLSNGFTAPIKNAKGEIVGVITNRANVKWYENEFITLFEGLKKSGDVNAEMYLANLDGTVLFKHIPFEMQGRNEAMHEESVIFKENVFKDNGQLLELSKKTIEGSARNFDPIHKVEDLQGFYKLSGEKWIEDLGWVVVVAEDAKTALAQVNKSVVLFYLVQGMCVALAIAASIIFSIIMSKKISHLSSLLTGNSSEVDKEANSVASSATQLSESSTEQAAALQETVSAVDEISAMVEKNSDGAEKSREISNMSKESAEKGREIVEQMIQSIRDIESANSEMSHHMEQNSQELSEIVKLIADIENKTKVINEIVFQTKLLSFNASVEAARAGEYGKGFAVVAEEVGNLAQMSGRAANEISTLLNESVSKVQSIVTDSKQKVSHLMAESQNKVQVGTQVAEECGQALNEILTTVSELDVLVAEISTASREQSTGIREISKAMGQMEQVVQENNTVAQTSALTADNLKLKSSELKQVIVALNEFVEGEGAQVTSKPESAKNVISFDFKKSDKKKKETSQSVMSDLSKPQQSAQETTGSTKTESSKSESKKASGDFGPSSRHPGFKD